MDVRFPRLLPLGLSSIDLLSIDFGSTSPSITIEVVRSSLMELMMKLM